MFFDLKLSLQQEHPDKKLPVCPCCAQKFHYEAEFCPHCGFSFPASAEKFEECKTATRRIEDKAGCLRKTQRENISRKLAKLEDKCPPAVFAVHIPLSLERQQLRQFSTWALNTMSLSESDLDRPDWTLLLVFDVNNKAVTFAYGYKLEPYLDENDLYPALVSGATYLRDGQYEQAILIIMKKAQKILIKKTLQMKKQRKAASTHLYQGKESS